MELLSSSITMLLGAAVAYVSYRFAHKSYDSLVRELLLQLRQQNKVIASADLQVYAGMSQVDHSLASPAQERVEPGYSEQDAIQQTEALAREFEMASGNLSPSME